MSPRLLLGRNGQVLRLSQRRLDERTGGGGVILAEASGDGWKTLTEIRSTESGVTIRDPSLAISQDAWAVAYVWWRNSPRAKQTRVARSDDGGKTWSLPEQPLDSSGKTFDPNIAWGRGKTLVVIWAEEQRGGRQFDVYMRRSPDGGVTWEPAQLLSDFPEKGPTDAFARPHMIGDGQGRFWTVWLGIKNGRSSFFLNRSLDDGRTWTKPTPLTGDSQSVFGHTLVRTGEHMLLVWHDTRTGHDRVYAVSSTDAGATWTPPARVDHLPDSSEAAAGLPSALLGPDGEALVAWQDPRNGREDIFLGRSTDGGRTWPREEERMDADEPGTAVSKYAQLARAADGRVALVWDDDRAGLEDVYLRVRSAGDQRHWGPEIRVSTPASKLAARLPQALWAPDGALYVAWEVWDHTLAPGKLVKRIETRILHPGKE